MGRCGLHVSAKTILYSGKSNVGDAHVHEVSGVYLIKDGLRIAGWHGERGLGTNHRSQISLHVAKKVDYTGLCCN